MHSLPGVALRNEQDSETEMPAFRPHSEVGSAEATPGRRAAICRILPGEDITEAAEAVCVDFGFERGIVRGSLGSFVGAWLHTGAGGVAVVDGPATEVVNVVGTVGRDASGSPTSELTTMLVDRYGTVHAGKILRGNNLVAVTFELFIVED
ncbi:hypothetical protein CH282_01535 [Rhodococcus sp. 06-418-1B]|nr:hypothetical protein CH282_01535 [Rhodococcus sp. 06-418-1B]